MKKAILVAIGLAMVFGGSAATSKSWPKNYWATMEATEAAQRPAPATESLGLAVADADSVSSHVAVPVLDTFLFGLFDSVNSITGFSTEPFGLVLFVR